MTPGAMTLTLTAPRRFRGTKNAVLVDCDGVLLDWIGSFRLYAQELLQKEIDPTGPENYDLHPWLGLPDAAAALELMKAFNSGVDGHFENLLPMPGAVDAIRALHQAGRDLHVITACVDNPQIFRMRRQNLHSVFGDVFSEIHCVGLRDSKAPLLQEHHESVWVEDHFGNAIAGAQAGHRTYLFRYPYNVAHEVGPWAPDLNWVNEWSEVVDRET